VKLHVGAPLAALQKRRQNEMNDKSNKVYLLQLAIWPKTAQRQPEYEDFLIREWHLSDVFTSLEKAVAFGEKEMMKKLEKYRTKLFEEWSPSEIAHKLVEYDFKVLELDPDVSRNQIFYDSEFSDTFGIEGEDVVKRNRVGSHWDDYVEWNYDYAGNLRYRAHHYGEDIYENDERLFYNRNLNFPEDDAEDAGTKFKVGEFVRVADSRWYGIRDFYEEGHNPDELHLLKNGLFDDIIYVVAAAPGKKRDCKGAFWYNHYELGRYDERGNYKTIHLHERYLRRYDADHDGELLPDDPLHNLLKMREDDLERKREQSRSALNENLEELF